MLLKYLFLGIFVKSVASFDDTITNIPIIASVAKTRKAKIFFSLGNLLAIILAIILAIFFSTVLQLVPYYRYVAVGLIFALAIAVYLDFFVHKPRTIAEKKVKGCSSVKHCTKIFGVGFIASFATVLDDIIVFAPLLIGSNAIYAVIGILIATVIEIIAVIYFSEKIAHVPYKEEIASFGLVTLGILILAGIV